MLLGYIYSPELKYNEMAPVGENIRLARLKKNYSQQNMADELDISQAAYSKLERDETEISIQRIYAIAEILEISPFELLPKPKYGLSVNLGFLQRVPQGIKHFWQKMTRRKSVPEVSA